MAISIFGTKANNTDIVVKDTSTGAVDLGSGNLTTTGTIAGNGSSITNLAAANLTGSLPAISGASLTGLTAANLTGAFPAIDGSSLTGISTSPIAASTLPTSNFGNGYAKFTGGYTIQWGKRTGTGNTTITVSFPVTFTYVYSIVLKGAFAGTTNNPGSGGQADHWIYHDNSTSTSQFKFQPQCRYNTCYWVATGFIS